MTSLAEVYEREVGEDGSLRRLSLGVGLFLLGAGTVVTAILLASTEALWPAGWGIFDARLYAGVIGGVGAPTLMLGVFAALPTGRRTHVAAAVGTAICLLAVALFWEAYPCQWIGANCGLERDLTLPTVGLYFLGTLAISWSLLVGVANVKTRNDPGGTVTMEVTRQGEKRVIEVPASEAASVGGVGLFGDRPDGEVETQTNRPGSESTASDGGESRSGVRSAGADASGAGGGPSGSDSVSTPNSPAFASESKSAAKSEPEPATGVDAVRDDGPVEDSYCGSCAHFRYVRSNSGMRPYCGYHDELMDDMEACDRWTPRERGEER